MGIQGLISQGLLLLAGLAALLAQGLTDAAFACALAALLLAIAANLLHPRPLGYLPCALALALCFPFTELLRFIPLMVYLCLALPDGRWPALLFILPIAAHARQMDALALVTLLAALLLRRKDELIAGTLERYFAAVDDSSEHSTRQQQKLNALQLEQEASVKLAIAQERNRIARDIHDNVGHILSRSLLQVRALSLGLSDPEVRRDLEELHDSLATGMNAIRHSVHNTRQDTLHLDREIRALLDGFSFCPVRYTNSSAGELSLSQKYVVMAIIREALSNIMRHSNATQATVTLSGMTGSHLLLISDNGSAPSPRRGQGMGLSAMEERVRGLGGSMVVSAERGFRILITLPREESA